MNSAFRYKSVFFFYFTTVGIYFPLFPVYLESIGLAAGQIGTLMSLVPLFNMTVPPLFGYWSDRHRMTVRFLQAATLSSTVLAFGFLTARSFTALMMLMAVYAIFRSPVPPLINAAALAHSGAGGEEYGRLRVWGSVGFIFSTLLVSHISDLRGPMWILYGYLACSVASLLSISRLRADAPAPVGVRLADAGRILKSPWFWVLFAAVVPHWACQMAYGTFFNIHLDRLGHPRAVAGWMWTLGTLSELGILYYGDRLVARFGVHRLLAASFGISAVRWAVMATTASLPWIAACQLTHSFSFGVFYMASIHHVERNAPPELRATAQSLYAALILALGGTLGINAAGRWVEHASTSSLFAVLALVNAAALLPLVALREAMPVSSRKA